MRKTCTLLLAFSAALLAPHLFAAEVMPASRRFEIAPVPELFKSGHFDHVAATVISLGSQGFAVGWESHWIGPFTGHDVTAGRRLLLDGSPAEWFEPTTWVDEYGWAGELAMAHLGEGRFVSVACLSAYNTMEIWYRLFAAGQPDLDPESVPLFEGSDVRSESEPHVASNGNGRFVIAWNRTLSDGEGHNKRWQKMARVFGEYGQPVTPAISVTELVPGENLSDLAVAMAADESFVVLWMEDQSLPYPIWGRRFDRTGKPLGKRFRIGDQGARDGGLAMAMTPSGELVVAWTAPRQHQMLLSRFTVAGQQSGPVVRLARSAEASDPAIAIDRAGRRVALYWLDVRQPALAVFDASLRRLGPVVFDPPASPDPWPFLRQGVAFADDGRILTVWVGPSTRGKRSAILGRFWRVR